MFLHLGIGSLYRFRNATIGMQQKVNSLFEFERAEKHARNLLDATFRHSVAQHVSPSDFYYHISCATSTAFSVIVSQLLKRAGADKGLRNLYSREGTC
jgi:hypothetical protein